MERKTRTPEEIKKGLMCCWKDGCANCPYDDDCEYSAYVYIARDALSYIRQLEAKDAKKAQRISELEQELAAVKRERDAALADLDNLNQCYICAHVDCWDEEPCFSCIHRDPIDNFVSHFEWRGVCPENTEESSNVD